jgi:uncharacterized protein YbjT (DUF2867 family)
MANRNVFIAGSTGYLGSNLIPLLLNRGHRVAGLVRKGSEQKLVAGCEPIPGDALHADSYKDAISGDTFVHLIGVPHPSPAKAELFRAIDLPAVKASVAAAVHAKITHFVYLSVAHPAPVMKAYVETRVEAEDLIRSSGLNSTFLQPWYVLGPGHRWAYALLPFYKILEMIPSTREGALRMGLVTLKQMMAALIYALEHPAQGVRVIDVPRIRATDFRES